MQELVILASIFLLLFSLTPYAPFSRLYTDLPSHFILQYAIGAIVVFVVALIFKSPLAVHIMLAAALCLCLWQLKPFIPKAPQTSAGNTLKILQVNVLFLNKDTVTLRNLVDEEKPDIILAAEVNTAFAKMFRNIISDYPHQTAISSDETAYGIAVLSKTPLEPVQKKDFDMGGIPAQLIKMQHDGKLLSIVSIHPANPVNDIGSRDREFAALEKWFAEEKPEYALLAGDFNATPYCPALKQLQKQTGLQNAREGKGLYGSWPSWVPPFMRIPIDHTLVTKNIGVVDLRVGSDIGSDHLPVITSLVLE